MLCKVSRISVIPTSVSSTKKLSLLAFGLLCAAAWIWFWASPRVKPSPDVRSETADLMESLSASPAGLTLHDENAVVEGLEKIGVPAVPALEQFLVRGNDKQKTIAMVALKRIQEARQQKSFKTGEVWRYLNLVSDKSLLVRTYAMESLIASGREHRWQVQAKLKFADPVVRSKLQIVLQEIDRAP